MRGSCCFISGRIPPGTWWRSLLSTDDARSGDAAHGPCSADPARPTQDSRLKTQGSALLSPVEAVDLWRRGESAKSRGPKRRLQARRGRVSRRTVSCNESVGDRDERKLKTSSGSPQAAATHGRVRAAVELSHRPVRQRRLIVRTRGSRLSPLAQPMKNPIRQMLPDTSRLRGPSGAAF